MENLSIRTPTKAPVEKVFEWYSREGALERLSPPWEGVEVLERTGGLEKGARTVLRLRIGPVKRTSVYLHKDYVKNRSFRDVQVSGPFDYWEHTHLFEPDGTHSSHIVDKISYELPLGFLGKLLLRSRVRDRVERTFQYRHRVTQNDLAAHLSSVGEPRKILVTGSTGFIAAQLIPFLTTGGHIVVPMIRSKSDANNQQAIYWDPEEGILDRSKLEGLDAVIHLSGENIASGRWSDDKKEAIYRSRVESTRLLSESLSRLRKPPEALICASATGYYGDTGETIVTEGSPLGSGFLSDVCRDWERSTEAAAGAGVRVVNLRAGIVLSPSGGILKKLLTLFRLGLGGKLGSGKQYMSWISMDDLLYVILYAISNRSAAGPINAVSPNPVTNLEFTRTLGSLLSRPTVLMVPSFALRLIYGEMAGELALGSCRALPEKLLKSGFDFHYPSLKEALGHTLGKQ